MGQPTRLILFLALVVVAAAVALAMAVVGADTLPSVGSEQGAVEEPGEADVPTPDSAGVAATDSTDDANNATATSDDAITMAVDEACRQFESGATVADFAVWFEANWDGADLEETFRGVIENALTVSCPEVVPSD